MPDLKISQLPVATTPLAGTELVPIVQGGVTDRTTVAAFLSAGLPVSATTLSASGAVTLSGGTANGVLYLDGSKVATSGSALVFDGTRLLVQTTSSNISSSERLTVNGLATTSISSTTVPAIYAQNSDTTASTNQPYIYLHDGVASRAGLGVNYTDSALVLNGFGGIYFRYGGNGMGTTEGMRLTSTGLGIGTTPTARLHTFSGTAMKQLTVDGTGAIKTGINFANGGATYGQIYFDNNSPYDMSVVQQYITGSLIFGTNNTECARLSGGNLLVGDTSNYLSSRVLVKTTTTDSSTNALTLQNSAATDLLRVRSDGYTYAGFYAQTTGSAANVFIDAGGDLLRSTSSLKYKTDVQDAKHGLAEVMQLRPVTYKGKSEADIGKTFGGLIAEEVHAAGLTEFVQYAEDGSPDALAYGNMVSVLVKAIQEQQALITALTARVAALESQP